MHKGLKIFWEQATEAQTCTKELLADTRIEIDGTPDFHHILTNFFAEVGDDVWLSDGRSRLRKICGSFHRQIQEAEPSGCSTATGVADVAARLPVSTPERVVKSRMLGSRLGGPDRRWEISGRC